MKKILFSIGIVVVAGLFAYASTTPPPFSAQTILLGSGTAPTFSQVAGNPNGTACSAGDTAWDTSTPALWQCHGGTIWVQVGSVGGTGTLGDLTAWTATNQIGNYAGTTACNTA